MWNLYEIGISESIHPFIIMEKDVVKASPTEGLIISDPPKGGILSANLTFEIEGI